MKDLEILENTVINHPDGIITLMDLQLNVRAWNNNIDNKNAFGFTSKTVQALINKIIELQKDINRKNHDL